MSLHVESLLVQIAAIAIVVKPVRAPPAPDPGDQLLWELLCARLDLVLVTGDKLLQADSGMTGRILSPATFAAAFTNRVHESD